jgi:hypothetical protein
MLHEPAAPIGADPAAPFKTHLGLSMFLAKEALSPGLA